MKKSTIICVALAAIAFAGCSKDETSQPTDGRVALNVTSGIQTRAYDNMWESGDAIGIYMLNGADTEVKNEKYITNTGGGNGVFAPAVTEQTIYFPVNGDPRDFVAYYPYVTIGEDNLYSVDVTNQTTQKNIDLMAATKVTGKSKTNASVAFEFVHKLVKLEIVIKGDATSITDAELANTVVAITNQQTKGSYVVEGNVFATIQDTPEPITLLTAGLKSEGIVLPNSTTEDMKLTFTVPGLSNQMFSWAINSAEKSQSFEAGKKYKYTITIGKQSINVTSTVVDWTLGNGVDGESGTAE